MENQLRMLIIEDNENDALLLIREMKRRGYDLNYQIIKSAPEMETALETQEWDLIISDYQMPHFSGITALEIMNAKGLDIPFIILSGVIDEDMAITSMKKGANDCILKSNLPRLLPAIDRELKEAKGRKERRRADIALKHSEERFRSLVETSSDLIWEVDKNGTYTYVSPKVKDLLGYDQKDITGNVFYGFMPQDKATIARKIYEDLVADPKDFKEFRKITLHKDGRHLILESSGVPIFDHDGHFQGYRGIDRDITERLHMQEIMIQTEKMMSIGGLAAGIAHEINNPLAGIMQNIQVIMGRLALDRPKNISMAKAHNIKMEAMAAYFQAYGITDMFDSILESSKRAARIVQNILSFGRKSESTFALSDLAKLLDITIELAMSDYNFRNKNDFNNIKIIKAFDSSVPKVPCEASKIQQVFLNILINGAQAMAGHASTQHHFILRLSKVDDMVQIEFEDNGPGMTEEVRKNIFEPFYTTKDVNKGTGLGLSVSYYIITENHKGSIRVESTPGKGSIFIIRLPVSQEEA